MPTMKKQNLPEMRSIFPPTFTPSQEFSAFIPTNTRQLNQHAHVQNNNTTDELNKQHINVKLSGICQLSQSYSLYTGDELKACHIVT